jgi:hypothetical protein
MRGVFALTTTMALIAGATIAAFGQNAVPSLKGTWKGNGKILLYGTTEHLSGSAKDPVVRDLEVTHTVTGQDGRLIWGTTSSTSNDSKEPFAWALQADGKTIVGADTDGYYQVTILSPDQIEKCYAQSGTSPRQAIVATCFVMSRVSE